MGWATTKSGRAFYNNEQLFSLPRKPVNTVLYAVWTPVTTRTVTFNSNSGIGSYTQDIPVNTSAYLKENQNQINRDGYRFDGWTTNANGTGTYYADGASYPMGRASATLYAKWSQEPGSTMITFNPNWKVCTENQGCPQSGTGIMAPQLIPAGSTTTKLNANTFRPSQRCEISPIGKKECWDAYGFTGWRTAASVSVPGQKGYSDKAVFLPIPGVPSITLYANWYPYGAAAPDSHNYASVSVSWESFLKLLQALR